MNKHTCIIIASLCAFFSCHGKSKANWQYNDYQSTLPVYESNWQSDHRLYKEKQINHESTCTQATENAIFSSTDANRLINGITVGHVLLHVYKAYQELHAKDQRSSIMDIVQTPKKYASFLMNCLEGTCKALLYKTVAQLILACADGDIIDFTANKLKKIGHILLY